MSMHAGFMRQFFLQEEILQSLQSSVEQEEKAKGEQSDEKVTALTRVSS